MLRSYTGERSKLGVAEQFFLLLGELKGYAVYVDGLLQMEEFGPNVDALRPQLDNYIGVCKEILSNRKLKEFLKLILITGNFINSVSRGRGCGKRTRSGFVKGVHRCRAVTPVTPWASD